MSDSCYEHAGTRAITISGIKAKATATGDLSFTVGGATIDSQFGPAGDKIVVAKGVPVGTVSVTGPTKLIKVGPGKVTNGVNAAVKLAETTYGSITKASIGQSEVAYISVTPSAGKLTAVTIAVTAAWQEHQPSLTVVLVRLKPRVRRYTYAKLMLSRLHCLYLALTR